MKNEEQFTRKLVDLFYPLVEVTFFNNEGLVLEQVNPFSTVKEDQGCDLNVCTIGTPFQELLSAGRSVRSLIDVYDEGYVRVRYDLTHFKNLQASLEFLLGKDLSEKDAAKDWKEAIDQVMNDFFAENKITAQGLSQKQKRELLSKLQKRALFDFKDSSSYVASRLNTSRATIYNYLKTLENFRKVHVHQVDAFTSERFGGNPAGVVLDAENLDDVTMRKIARELNLSETAFVIPSKKGAFQMRYFTPTGHEIKFCGHSTVGALFMIAKEKRFGAHGTGSHKFDVETLCGIMKMEVSVDEEEGIKVAYEAPPIHLKKVNISHADVAKASGFDLEKVELSYPVMYEETNKDLYLVIRSLDDLKNVECDAKTFAQFSKQHDIVCLCLVTSETFDKKNQFHMRCFAPLVGIPEDPFTGSVLGGLTAYLDTFNLLKNFPSHFRVEQGHFVERPGVVDVEYKNVRGKYHVKVNAQAVHCFSTEINLK